MNKKAQRFLHIIKRVVFFSPRGTFDATTRTFGKKTYMRKIGKVVFSVTFYFGGRCEARIHRPKQLSYCGPERR